MHMKAIMKPTVFGYTRIDLLPTLSKCWFKYHIIYKLRILNSLCQKKKEREREKGFLTPLLKDAKVEKLKYVLS